MEEPPGTLEKVTGAIDAVSRWSGRIVAVLIYPLVFGLTYEVIARYAFNAPTIWAYDVSYMLYGSHFMLGAAYTLQKGGHIRTDIFYGKWSPRRQGLIDAALYVFFFFPGLIFFFWAGWNEALHAWSILETSEASPWRPPLYPFKTVVPVAAVFLLLQGMSEFLKCLHAARRGRWP